MASVPINPALLLYINPFNAAFKLAIVPVAVIIAALLIILIKFAVLLNANTPWFAVTVIVSMAPLLLYGSATLILPLKCNVPAV